MKSFATAAILLALTASAIADDATALKGLTQCVSNSKGNIPYVNGWGLGLSTATTGRKLKQTAQNCADAAAISSAIPCTPQTSGTPTTPTTPTFSTPPTAGSAPGVSTTPSGIPTGTSGNPCGDTQNPVPWTGLLCTNGAVTSVIMSQLGPNIFRGSCDLSTLSDLAGLASLQVLDFTASGLSGSIPATWTNGSWAGSLRSLTLAQNPNVTGPIPSFANLTALTSIDVSSSGLTGPIPLSSQGYPSLRSFVAVGNKLSGSLPASLPANLTTLNVGNNALNGTIPVYNSSVLGTFQVNNNSLTGCLPSQWASSLTNITNVDLSYNQLSGPIPSTWQAQGAFPTLQQINIVGNNLCGSLGSLGTPVAPVGQNNPNASRLVPNPGSLAACSGDVSCDDTDSTVASQARALYALNAYAPAPGPGNALAPDSAIRGQEAPALPVLPTDTTPAVQVTG